MVTRSNLTWILLAAIILSVLFAIIMAPKSNSQCRGSLVTYV